MEFKIGTLLMVWAIFIGIYVLFKLFQKPDSDIDKDLNKVLNSKEHKVKGQYD